jgi:hypothetical protein
MTASGHLLGTPEYMSAEQVEGRPIDHRTDLYAAGAVLYQLLSGRAPFLRFSNTQVWELIRRVQNEQPPSIRQLRPEVPPALASVVERAMAKDPDQRFQTAYEMRLALAEAIGREPPPPQAPPATMPPPGATQVMPVPNVAGPVPAPPAGGPATRSASQSGQSPSGQPQRGGGTVGPFPPPPPGGTRSHTPVPPMGSRPDARRTRTATWKIVAWAIAALVLVIVGVAVGRIVPLPGSSPRPTPTVSGAPTAAPPAAVVPASPTPAPATGAASGASAASASPVGLGSTGSAPASPSVPPKPTNAPGVLLADTFENAEIGQLPRVSARPTDYVFAYDRGEYVMNKINAALPAAPIVFLPGTYDNTVIALDVRIVGDVASRYAFVVCRDQSSGGQAKQYRVSIVPEGRRLILSRWDDGSQRVLSEVRDDAAINPGSAVNRLELRCAGPKISAAVNGKTLVSADDTALNRGEQGLGAGTFAGVDGTLEARFDNLEIKAP